VVADAPPEADVADAGDLAVIEGGLLGLELQDRPADVFG